MKSCNTYSPTKNVNMFVVYFMKSCNTYSPTKDVNMFVVAIGVIT